jgi:hypothetical protein
MSSFANRAKSQAEVRAPSESLQKLKRGELSLDEYLDAATENALAPLKGRVSADVLDNFRETLRESLRTDPILVELVQRLTGQTPQLEPQSN